MSAWRTVRLGEVCQVIAGQSPPGSSYNSDGVGLPFYQGKKEFGVRQIDSPTSWTTEPTKVASPGDILMSVRAPVGPVNFLNQTACIGRGLAAIRARDDIYPDFLFYNLLMREAQISGKEGAVFASINRSEIAALEVPLPSVEEQRRIVAVLDEAFAAMATAAANAEKNLANAGGLVGTEVQWIFSTRGEGWAEYKLPEISINLDSQRKPVTKKDRVPGDIPYYGASGQVDSVRDYLFDCDLLLISEDGANLLARTYPIAFTISGKSWVNNHAHILKFDHSPTQRLVEHYLNSISLEPWVSGMAQPKLNQKALNRISIPLPPEGQRENIAERLDALTQECDILADFYERTLAELIELKRALLASAFDGSLFKKSQPLAA